MPPRRIDEIVLGARAFTADSDLRLTRHLGMSEGFFLGLQADFKLLEQHRKIAKELKANSASRGTETCHSMVRACLCAARLRISSL